MDFKIDRDIQISNISSAQKTLVRNITSFDNPAYLEAQQFGRSLYGLKKKIRLYKEKGGNICVPRGCLYKLVENLGAPDNLIDTTAYFDPIDIPSNIELRELQKPWIEELLKHNQGIGVAAAGSGKTVAALHIIATLGQPVLWLTHRRRLVDQLKERAGFFIEAGEIGVIGGGKNELGDIITVGMTQTVSRRDLNDISHKFGVVIVDESHIVPALQAMKSIQKFAPRYLYGLTATPFREDGLDQVMFDTVGPTLVTMDRDKIVEKGDIIPANVIVRKTNTRYNKMDYTFAEVIEYLTKNEPRNRMIVDDILTELALGKVCIALTSRIEHGATLKKMFDHYEVGSEHIHSEQTEKQQSQKLARFKDGEVNLIIATYQLLSEGFDHTPSSRIFFCLPYKARGLIEQSKGRIERKSPGKEDAFVYDYVDDIQMLLNQFEVRTEQYLEHGLEIIDR